jgi:hypothetical protein
LPTGIYKRSKQQIENMRIGMLGKNSKEKIPVICESCGSEFKITPSRIKRARFCSRPCQGRFFKGEKSCHWKGGIDYRGIHSLFNPKYVEWRTAVFTRDNWKCKMENGDCVGTLEVHHILPWRDYVELRFNTNNGITLCHFHHPRKRKDEKELSPYFQELVAESK